jgi:5-oxoprolinase (ATP-hydrolysing)
MSEQAAVARERAASSSGWQFWIDVGGTFTDFLGRRPDGQLLRHKLLSSGVTRGTTDAGSDRTRIVDPARRSDPEEFWSGCQLRLLDRQGRTVAQTAVVGFERKSATLQLAEPLAVIPVQGQTYELASDEEAPIQGIRYLLGLGRQSALPPVQVRLGTTRGTNALITRRGARTALVTTRGFGDILRIGYQNRPKLFALAIRKPEPLFAAVVEIDERIAADGQVLRSPDTEAVRAQLAAIREEGIESLAVCLMHAYAHPQHEELIGRIARELGYEEVSLSHRVAPLVKIVFRGDTTVVDAYLNPVLRSYVARLRRAIGGGRLQILTSAGGLVEADQFVGKDSILSGPAGGVIGFSHVARAAGFQRAIGFDMGGTSTDVSRFDGRYQREYETEKAGVRVVAPMMAIETVAAGGGSICRFDGVKLSVGPDSAGADPGPACYGRGGPLAVTDMNFYQGKVLADYFPFPLDHATVQQRLQALCDEMAQATGRRYQPHELADGFLRVANANMVKAIRSVSIAQGADPREYVLVAFGGAAGQHACAVARELAVRQIICPPDAGVLSAYGIGLADVARHRLAGVYQPYSQAALAGLEAMLANLAREAREEVLAEGVAAERIEVHRSLDLRYQGLDACLTIPEPPADGNYAESYVAEHKKLYGYAHEGRPLEIVAARVEVVGQTGGRPAPSRRVAPHEAVPARTVETWFDGRPQPTQVFLRRGLRPGGRLRGPAILCEAGATVSIDPGWEGEVLSAGELLLTEAPRHNNLTDAPQDGSRDPPAGGVSAQSDPVMLEVFNNQFAGIAEQMGVTLRNTATSVNIKERLDFSCALFTPGGDLVVNAPHIPVHLGAMAETVRQILADNPGLRPGDVFATNDPYRGGSHLPDVTVVTPVHDAAGERLLFFTASRAHHAEIGGITPGSMPPWSKNLAEEGVLIGNLKIVEAGRPRFDELRAILLSGPYPTRNVDDNLADIAAQIAANHQGARDLLALMERYSTPVVAAYMRHIQAAAEQKMRAALARLSGGMYRFVDRLDDGSPIAVTITVAGDEATIDFSGSGPVVPGNLNANRAIVTAAVMYCLRLLIQEDIPLNQGVLAPVRLVLPEGLLNPSRGPSAEQSAAIAGGNVETSQRVVDAVLGALGLAAASQGTMNNLLFGNGAMGYYETICGGAGATAEAEGASAIHTHMTNTRATDPEVLERRWPVRLREFSIRRGSGGAGRHGGGDGVVRRLEFLADLEVSILSQRRGPYLPYGLEGGDPGAPGRNILQRSDGSKEILGGIAYFRVHPGDCLTIETPGGGGFGKAL